MKDTKLSYQELESSKDNSNRITHEFGIWLHDIRSVHNVGSAFRTSDASGAEKIYLSGYSPHPPREDISKTALGAEKSVPFVYEKNILAIAEQILSEGKSITAVELTHNAIPHSQLTASDLNTVYVFGNEVSGIPQDLLDLCSKSVYIPMFGSKHSLNVSVAIGIISYQMVSLSR